MAHSLLPWSGFKNFSVDSYDSSRSDLSAIVHMSSSSFTGSIVCIGI